MIGRKVFFIISFFGTGGEQILCCSDQEGYLKNRFSIFALLQIENTTTRCIDAITVPIRERKQGTVLFFLIFIDLRSLKEYSSRFFICQIKWARSCILPD